ncbi:hypothetical protein J2S74_002918 [Evansella vedderi]|uniref:DUF4367 domain-containing protein n=1 Tax=Evansella vedderi TaxID=38282 RepID=A0ABT9ZXT3_9BACI|nr:hypothetical protein [Evansella vedderi]MDQ0255536.1 hypothetical protein [Evansella vedderi]
MIYVFHIVDEGIIQRVISRENLEELSKEAKKAITNYSDGWNQPATTISEGNRSKTVVYTEDGYATVFKVDPSGKSDEDKIWSYPFDGESLLEEAISELQRLE